MRGGRSLIAEAIYLMARGFMLVGLVSWQTRNLQRGGAVRIWVGAFLLGCCWYTNVLAAVEQLPWGWAPYAFGSAWGAVAGWRLSHVD